MTTAADLYRFKALLLPWGVRGIDTWAATGSAWWDGDTFNALVSQGMETYRLTHVRTAGYDAPEVTGTTKAAGEAAAAYVRTLVDTGGVVYIDSLGFEPDEEDNFGRMIGAVTLADGRDLTALMIDSGHAVADPA